MSNPYARGKYAYGYCDRTGFRYPLKDLVFEIQNGVRTGLRVGRDVVDPDQPQNFLGRIRIFDPQSLRDPRPDRSLQESRGFFNWPTVGDGGDPPDGTGSMKLTVSLGSVTVTTS
jgi:hypothetical protein|tara:strand:+ start:8708 stop:9052 length:345 start_codon:yes stop_codon:yes gene_type:complete